MRRMILTLTALSFAAAPVTQIAQGAESSVENKGDEIVLGFAGALTGGAYGTGQAQEWGFQLAIEDINKAGGVLGKKVRGVSLDDESDPTKAIEAVKKLIHFHKVVAISGVTNSGNMIAVHPVVQEAKIPIITSSCTATSLPRKYENEPTNYMFRFAMPDNAQSMMMALYLAEKVNYKGNKIAIMHDTEGYGLSGEKDLRAAFDLLKVKGVVSVPFPKSQKSMLEPLSKLKAQGIEAIGMYSPSPFMVQMKKDADALQFKPVFVSTWGMWASSFWDAGGKDIESVVGIASSVHDKNERTLAFHERIKAKFLEGKEKAYGFIPASQSYDATLLMAKAIDASKSTEGEKIVRALENIKSYQSLSFDIKGNVFTKKKHDALDMSTFFYGQWKDGKSVALKDELVENIFKKIKKEKLKPPGALSN